MTCHKFYPFIVTYNTVEGPWSLSLTSLSFPPIWIGFSVAKIISRVFMFFFLHYITTHVERKKHMTALLYILVQYFKFKMSPPADVHVEVLFICLCSGFFLYGGCWLVRRNAKPHHCLHVIGSNELSIRWRIHPVFLKKIRNRSERERSGVSRLCAGSSLGRFVYGNRAVLFIPHRTALQFDDFIHSDHMLRRPEQLGRSAEGLERLPWRRITASGTEEWRTGAEPGDTPLTISFISDHSIKLI